MVSTLETVYPELTRTILSIVPKVHLALYHWSGNVLRASYLP